MKPAKLDQPDRIYKLPGGTEENDLHVNLATDEEDNVVVISRWELTDEERERVASGADVELLVWGVQHPPVLLRLHDG